jgi:hypothetical protein
MLAMFGIGPIEIILILAALAFLVAFVSRKNSS